MIQKNKLENNKQISQPDNITSIQNVSIDIGAPKVSNNTIGTKQLEINDKQSLYCRELNTQPIVHNTNHNNVMQIVKMYAFQSIELQIRLITKVDPTYSVQYNENDSFEELAFKWAEGDFNMYKFKIHGLPETEQAEQELLDSLYNAFVAETKKHGLDTVYNGGICWNMLASFFKRHWEDNENRQILKQFQFAEIKNDSLITGIDAVIDQAIINLEKIKNDIYLSKFRTIIDLDHDLQFKYQKIRHYFQLPNIDENINNERITFTIFTSYALPKMQIMICQVSTLQIFLDCLKELKKAPKVAHNVKLTLNICSQCIEFFTNDSKLFNVNKNKNLNSAFTNDYLEIQSALKTLEAKLKNLLHSQSEDWLSPTMQSFLKSSAKKQVRKPKGKENNNQRALAYSPSIQQKPAVITEAIECQLKPLVVVQQPQKVKPVITRTTSDNPEQMQNTIVAAEDPQDIEEETNVLMEIFRQRLESDRKSKLEQKALKQKKPELATESPESPTATINTQSITQFKKLSTKRQTTLKMLFAEKLPHFTIKATSIQKLINALGGIVKGSGKGGSQFSIYWGNSQSQAGTYEVAHGRDAKGYLTSDYAANVAKAIKVGVENAHIARETIECVIAS